MLRQWLKQRWERSLEHLFVSDFLARRRCDQIRGNTLRHSCFTLARAVR